MQVTTLKNGIVYNLVGDYYLPDLTLPEQTEKVNFGRYGRMHLKFMRENQRFVYTDLVMSNRLNEVLNLVDSNAKEMFEGLVKDMAAAQGVTEQLKADNQLKWVGLMNNIRNAADEIVMKELIYK